MRDTLSSFETNIQRTSKVRIQRMEEIRCLFTESLGNLVNRGTYTLWVA